MFPVVEAEGERIDVKEEIFARNLISRYSLFPEDSSLAPLAQNDSITRCILTVSAGTSSGNLPHRLFHPQFPLLLEGAFDDAGQAEADGDHLRLGEGDGEAGFFEGEACDLDFI